MEIEKVKQKVRNKRDKGITKNQIKSPKAITLIALVITIIVLLILAAVSIATLTGENGILTRAGDARTKTNEAEAVERVNLEVLESYGTTGGIDIGQLNKNLKNVDGLTYNGNPISDSNQITSLPATVILNGHEIQISSNGNVAQIIRLQGTDETKPYLPSSSFHQVEGTQINTGLVITDGTNSYVWIEVPISETERATNDSEIETALQTYATDYRSSWTDEWYDYYGTTYDGASEYSKVKYITSSTRFTNAKTYYGTIYTDNTGTTEATSYASGTTYYAKITDKINDTSECGLTYSKYNELKSKMLNSIKNNGGFWIGQYEMGTDTARIRKTDPLTTPVCKEGAYPYNYVTCSQAQERASTLSTGNYTSSLMFGIQWDLVCKFIETNATNPGSTVDTIQKAIKNNSKDWGNYKDASFEITRGQYTTSPSTANSWKNFDIRTDGYVENNTKLASTSVLLTTGATERNSLLNIYDFAGNVMEWTLEKSSYSNVPCSDRGGSYSHDGSRYPASARYGNTASISYDDIGFRPTLYQ